MCGIAGIVGPDAQQIRITSMIQQMYHRGPDANGTFLSNKVALGHTRLSIVDLSENASQPMTTSDKQYTIVYNGEVYNSQALRETHLKGVLFKSTSDTETILRLYEKFGIEMPKYLRGMFAFLIYDEKEKILFGARDRMGIKPLLYTKTKDNYLFASELKALTASGLFDTTIEEKAIRQLFLYGAVQSPFTFLKGVFSIPPAHSFLLRGNRLALQKFWEFPTEVDSEISFEQAKAQFKETYEEAINIRMISDRPTGIFLSSGMDSVSMLAGLNNELVNTKAITVGFKLNHKKFVDETDKARRIAQSFGVPHHQVYVDQEHLNFEHFFRFLDQPSIDGLNTYLVSKASIPFLTVALSGLGGDELMMGYPRNINLFNKHQSKLKLPSYLSDVLLKMRMKGKGNNFSNGIYNRYGNPKNLKWHYWGSRLINIPEKVNQLLQSSASNIEDDFEQFFGFDDGYTSNVFNRISYYDIRTYMLNQLLRDMDAASMAHSIEVRFPMIDHKVIECLFRMPPAFKYAPPNLKTNHSSSKSTYRSTGMKYILASTFEDRFPADFLDTPKYGFQLPYLELYAKQEKQKILDATHQDPWMNTMFGADFLKEAGASAQQGKIDKNTYLAMALITIKDNLLNNDEII